MERKWKRKRTVSWKKKKQIKMEGTGREGKEPKGKERKEKGTDRNSQRTGTEAKERKARREENIKIFWSPGVFFHLFLKVDRGSTFKAKVFFNMKLQQNTPRGPNLLTRICRFSYKNHKIHRLIFVFEKLKMPLSLK